MMKSLNQFVWVALFFAVPMLSAQQKSGSSIVVQLNGIKAPIGQVLLSLFNAPEGFPTHPEKAFRWKTATVTSNSIIISLDGLPPGPYAIAVVHDENSNNVMDTDWLGLPEEEYGISNNVTGVVPPSFDEARFIVSEKRDTIRIDMHP
ncbi:MAG: DUF2141 domain-containing protein [Bacteroidetes bacterium]|nr:DUF2141 domain-containing protein [Bacteroidota bacterium]